VYKTKKYQPENLNPKRSTDRPKQRSRPNPHWHSLATLVSSHNTSIINRLQSTGNNSSSVGKSERQCTVNTATAQAIKASTAGAPINKNILAKVEPVMGADLVGVRVHTDPLAQTAAGLLNAKAFTYHNDIYLAAGQSETDLGLMAHELTHVVQQQPTLLPPDGVIKQAPNSIQCADACPAGLAGEIEDLRERIDALLPATTPERVDLEAQLAWRQQLAAQCAGLSGFTSTNADTLAYLKAEAMLHRGRIADLSGELARMEPTSSSYRISLDARRDGHREELIGVLEMRTGILEQEIASLRSLMTGLPAYGESSPEQALLMRYENEWLAHQNELQPLRRWRARRRINAIQSELLEINRWLEIVPQVCSREEPQAEQLLARRNTLLDEQQRLAAFLTGSMVEYEQWDPRWGATRYGTAPNCTNIRQAGCGPTSLAIVMNYLYSEDPDRAGAGGNIEIVTPPQTARYAETHGRVCNSGTAGDTMVTNVHTGWPGFRGRRIALDEATGFLRQGIPIIFLCRNCTGRTRTGRPSRYGGHFMVLRSVNPTGDTYSVLDPGRGERRDVETISAAELRQNNRGFWVIERI
jgi:hypothetical protein